MKFRILVLHFEDGSVDTHAIRQVDEKDEWNDFIEEMKNVKEVILLEVYEAIGDLSYMELSTQERNVER